MVIGVDALDRMLDPKWGPAVNPMLVEYAQLGTIFYVAPRIIAGRKLTLDQVLERHHIDPELGSIFVELQSASALSSTSIREGKAFQA